MQSTLILNASYEPLSIVSSHRAVNLILADKAVALDASDRIIRAAKFEMAIPYVAKMNYFVKKNVNTKEVPFSRKGVLVRDNHKCGYCGKHAETIDHIVPKSRGGENTYANTIACCLKCNGKKGSKLLHEVGFSVGFRPVAPSLYSTFLLKAIHNEPVFNAWSEYVFMYQPDLEKYFQDLMEKRFLVK